MSVVLGLNLVFVSCPFLRCHIIVHYGVFHVSWFTRTRMFQPSYRIFSTSMVFMELVKKSFSFTFWNNQGFIVEQYDIPTFCFLYDEIYPYMNILFYRATTGFVLDFRWICRRRGCCWGLRPTWCSLPSSLAA